MKFKEFWPEYLKAHSLPGTRSLHYFASVIGLMSVVEAIVTRQPLLLAGIGLGYALAIGAHRFIELNRPMIRVNAFWGMVADVRMCWLALTGGLHREIDRSLGMPADDVRGKSKRMRITPIVRSMLIGVAALGLAAGLLDLDDLFETEIGLRYPLIQLGAPIAAFAGALFLGITAMAKSLSALSRDEQGPMSAAEESLWRASIALLAFGGLALTMAELAEHGYSQSAGAIAFGTLTSLIALTPALLVGSSDAQNSWTAPHPASGVVLAKRIGAVGGVVCSIGAVGILSWQVLRWITVGWEPLPLSAALTGLSVPVGSLANDGIGLAWILDMPAALAALVAATTFIIIGLRAASLERQRKETRLFKMYLGEARGSGPNRPMSDS